MGVASDVSRTVELVPLEESDAPELLRLWGDREATRLTNWRAVGSLDECRGKLARVLSYYGREPRHLGPYAIRDAGAAFLGIAGADALPSGDDSFEVWYFVRRDRWGEGIATAALRRLLERAGFERREPRPGAHREGLDTFLYELRI